MIKTLSIEAIQAAYYNDMLDMYAKVNDVDLRLKMQGWDDSEGDDGFDEEGENNYQVVDGVGIYSINGSILSSGSALTRWMGYADYDGIRNDILAMSKDPEVQEIMILAASPGGSVYGPSNASVAIKSVDKIKPVYTYCSKMCCSGMYWLAANSREIIAAPEAEVGSIGVIVTHISQQKAMEDAGYKATVIRTQELKAVGGPMKDLSEKEIEHITEQAMTYDALFQKHIQTVRPKVNLRAMKGQTFIGEEGIAVGLVDSVMDYDSAINYIKSKRTKATQTGGYRMNMTAEQLRAALDAGKTLDELGLSEEDVAKITAEAAAESQSEEQNHSEPPEFSMTAEEYAEKEAGFKAEVEALAVKVAEYEGKIKELEAKAHVSEETEQLKAIVCKLVSNRRVALNLQNVDMTKFSVATVLVEYAAVTEQYEKAFVEGGLAGLKAQRKVEAQEEQEPEMDSIKKGTFAAVSL